jgi:hypothetical protein
MKKILRDIRNFKSADAAVLRKLTEKALEHHPDKTGDKEKVQGSC